MSSPIPYLGSKISLISKSEIRYEGILYTIDAQESIIALAKVRSFGTEDRPAAMTVHPADEVFEYIIFKGSDIKKIEVCETPKQPTINDPAIVHAGSGIRHSLGPIGGAAPAPSMFGGYSQQLAQQSLAPQGFLSNVQPSELPAEPVALPTPIGPPRHQQQAPIPEMTQHNSHTALAEVLSRSPTPTAAAQQLVITRRSPVMDSAVQVSPPKTKPPKEEAKPQREERREKRDFAERKERKEPQYERREGISDRREERGGYQGRRGQMNYNQGYGYNQGYNQAYRNQAAYHNQNYQNQYFGRGGSRGRGGMGMRGGPASRRGGGGRGTGILHPSNNRSRDKMFDEEYDFEQANHRFNEMIEQMENVKVSGSVSEKSDGGEEELVDTKDIAPKDPSPTCYDKKKSFFDNISGDKNQRPDWAHERKVNQETFGVDAKRRGTFYRGRGFYRGYNNRGYGGFRGGNNNYRREGMNRGGATNGTVTKAPQAVV